jgi:DNA-directed RNA polymerase specialized sigma24 family protein
MLHAMTTDAFARAYQTGYDSTVRFLLSRGAPLDGAQEAAQAGWSRGWERLSQLRDERMVTTWVNSIALNVYRGILRGEIRLRAFKEPKEGVFEFDHTSIDLARILKFCRPGERTLLEQQMEGATTREMARRQGLTEAAIRIRLLRARRAAKMRLERRRQAAAAVAAR